MAWPPSLARIAGMWHLGVCPQRTSLSRGLWPFTKADVLFRAKDMPSLWAEFSHPDIVVTLTCLSYYYTGLTREQLLLCFELFLRQDNPPLEYESWVLEIESVPERLQHPCRIITESTEQLDDLLRLFAFNKAVTKQSWTPFHLSRVVVPQGSQGISRSADLLRVGSNT